MEKLHATVGARRDDHTTVGAKESGRITAAYLLNGNSKIRSSTGLSIDWLTPIGPLNFVFAQPITKASTDVEQTFRFDIGTTF